MTMALTGNQNKNRFPSGLQLGLAAGLAACVFWAYWPALSIMVRRWTVDSQYSHGFLVPIFAAALLWLRRGLYQPQTMRGQTWGIPVLAAALGVYLFGSYIYIQWFESISLVPCVAGLCLLAGGWSLLRWAWPSVVFLAFMVPLPYTVEMKFCQQLQAFTTVAATFCLQTLGFPAFYEGTDITIGESAPLGVEKACSGLSMMMTFFALSTAVALLVKRPVWEKLLILASAVPIALVSNVTRVTATAILYQCTDNLWIKQKTHDWAGWMMMVLGLVLLAMELKYLSYLVPETYRAATDAPRRPALTPAPQLPLHGKRGPHARPAPGTA